MLTVAHATPLAWPKPRHKPRYGDDTTYALAAEWLKDCVTVADWGGARGYFKQFLPAAVRYTSVDGTRHHDGVDIVADLADYHEPSDGILLRHVVDMTFDWPAVLANALNAFRYRLVVVTCWEAAVETHVARTEHGWPVTHFNPDQLRTFMGHLLVRDDLVQTTHPERVYYLERAR